MQQILPDGESAFVDVLLAYAEAFQVCYFDWPALTGQKLQSVQAGPNITLCLLTQTRQGLHIGIAVVSMLSTAWYWTALDA